MKKQYFIYIPILLVLTLFAGVYTGYYITRKSFVSARQSVSQPANKLSNIIRLIESVYVDTVNINEIVEKSIPPILENLDPHSTYIPARDMQEVEEEMQGNFSGIGVQFSIQEDTIM